VGSVALPAAVTIPITTQGAGDDFPFRDRGRGFEAEDEMDDLVKGIQEKIHVPER
jgi:hypothetical protein